MRISQHSRRAAVISALVLLCAWIPVGVQAELPEHSIVQADRLWVINTRGITSQACRANLESPVFRFGDLACNGRVTPVTWDDYQAALAQGRRTVIYVHGNRMEADDAICRGLLVHRNITRFRQCEPTDWVIWSWPSEQNGILARDVRLKAERTDAQGLYLAWLLRKHLEMETPTTLIGYSFGGRVVTGALHALAGGSLGGRTLPGPSMQGRHFNTGLVAPAIESEWMNRGGYHELASKNLDQLLVLYNQRDPVLKRYWLIDQVRGQLALGLTGPRSFAPRADGSKVPVRSKDCSPVVGLHHDELDYYLKPCLAGREMANLIDEVQVTR